MIMRQAKPTRIILFILLVLILIGNASATSSGQSFKVEFDEEMYNYNHLGTDLSYTYTYNGKEIYSGDTIYVTSNQFAITTTIIEHDSINDVGQVSVTFNTNKCLSGVTKTATTTVHEKGGKRYPNATADFRITYTIGLASATNSNTQAVNPSVAPSGKPSTAPSTTNQSTIHELWIIFTLAAAFAIFGGGYIVFGFVRLFSFLIKRVNKDFDEYFDIPTQWWAVIIITSFLAFVLSFYYLDWAFKHYVFFTIIYMFCLALLLCIIVPPFGKKTYQKKNQLEEAQRLREEKKQLLLSEAKSANELGQLEKAKQLYTELFADWTLSELSGMPADTEIGNDGLPKQKGQSGWGSKYTFYITKNGSCFHRNGCQKRANAINALTVQQKKYVTCGRCNSKLPDLSWYSRYTELDNIRRNKEFPL